MKEVLQQRRVWFCLLAAAHLPYLLIHYVRLWQYEHYQFFPFALGIFAYLVRSRFLAGAQTFGVASRVLIAADCLLLVSGFVLNSPLLVCLGAFCTALAFCLSLTDSDTDGNLGYLALLLLITLRLPLGLDFKVIQWLQLATTRIASNILNHLSFLHFREGNVLEFPNKRFLVEEACSGVQSLFTVMFLATLIICGYRRKLFHSVLVVGSAVCFAGVMNVIRVVSIAVAWFRYDLDISSGWRHDAIGYLALIVAASLVFSTDFLLALMCSSVTGEPGRGRSSAFRNPFINFWNWFFQVPQPKKSGITPALRDLVKPRNFFGWFWNFVSNWVSSRNKKLFPVAAPLLGLMFSALGFIWWLESSPKSELVATYEAALLQAARDDDSSAKSVYLQSLVRLRPNELSYRFQFAMHLLDCGEGGRAIAELEYLTTPGRHDYAPARLWLARQALSAEPMIPLDDDQVEGQLLMALQLQPRNLAAKRLIGEVLLKRGQLKAAEDHFLDVVGEDPSLAISLAKVQKQLGRSAEQIDIHLRSAIDYHQQRLMQNPQAVDDRIRLSESLVIAGRMADAERVLTEGLPHETTDHSNSSELKSTLAKFYGNLADTRLRESLLNRDLCVEMLMSAIQLDPHNRGILVQALALNSLGAALRLDSLSPAIVSLRAAESLAKEDRMLLVQTLAACGQLSQAITEIRPLIPDHPEMNIVLARLLKASGQTEQFQQVVEDSLKNLAPTDENRSVQSVLEYADVLNLASQYEQSCELMLSVRESTADMSETELAQWNLLYGQTTIAMYDMKSQQDNFASTTESLQLLQRAWETNSVQLSVLKRLATLSCSEGKIAAEADRVLGEMLVKSNVNPDVYNLIGSQAIRSQKFEKARLYLERAFRLSRRNPMILNNLAIALVRGESIDPERALQLTKDALEVLPDHPDVLSTRAEVFVAMKRWEDARGDLEESLQKRPADTDSRRLLAQVCDELGEGSLAEIHRQRILELESVSN